MSFRPEDAAGQTTRGLQGSYTIDAGLAQLLAGTGLSAEPQPGQGYVVRPPRAASANTCLLYTSLPSQSSRPPISMAPPACTTP